MTDALTIYELITRAASVSPESPAFLTPGRSPLSYRGLLDLMTITRLQLRSCGIRRNDAVALLLRQGPDAAAAFLAVASATTSAPLTIESESQDWERRLKTIEAKALVVHAGFCSEATRIARGLGLPVFEVRPDPETEAGRFDLTLLTPAFTASADSEDWPGPDDRAMVLQTSGSSGQPKCVALTQSGLCLSSCRTVRSLELGASDRCLNMLPLHHVHGLVSAILMPLAAGGSVAFTSGFDASRALHWLDELQPTWIPAPPAMLQALLEQAQTSLRSRCTSLRFLRSGSTPLWPTLVEGLEGAFGVPVIEAYGMTEVPHITGNPLSKPRRGSVGRAVVDELAILDEAGQPLPPGSPGEIAVRGVTVSAHYVCQLDPNSAAFRDGWFRTGDLGWLDADGYLFLAGRLKEMINRGGQKVIPREVDDALLSHSAVREAAAFAVPHVTLGEDLAAVVVARDGQPLAEQELRQFVAKQLPGYKVPSRILCVDRLPREAGGKVRRTNLSATLSRELDVPHEPPAGNEEARVAAAFEEVLRLRVGRHDNFFAAGGDSLRATQVVARLGKELDLNLPATAVFEHPTVALLAAELVRRESSTAASTVAHDVRTSACIARQPRVPQPMPVGPIVVERCQ